MVDILGGLPGGKALEASVNRLTATARNGFEVLTQGGSNGHAQQLAEYGREVASPLVLEHGDTAADRSVERRGGMDDEVRSQARTDAQRPSARRRGARLAPRCGPAVTPRTGDGPGEVEEFGQGAAGGRRRVVAERCAWTHASRSLAPRHIGISRDATL